MQNTKTNNINSLINFNLTVLVSFLLITLSLFAVIISTTAKAQSSTTTTNPSSASSTPTNTGSPVAVTGTGTAGNTISIVLPDGSTATTTVKSDGTWSIIPLKPQVAGTVTVTELSPTGVVVTPAKTITYAGGVTTPASTTPKISIKDPYVCPGKITGYVDNSKATVTVVLSKDGVVVLTIPAVVNSDGSWSVDLYNKLPDGVYSNKFTATYNGMIATGTYDINHKNNCTSNSTNSTIRTGGMNLFASIAALSGIVLGLYLVLIKKFSK
jgi:hypothetical protein